MHDDYTNENDMVPCRLRVKGTFFVKNGVKQQCTMLNRTINITFGDDLSFKCGECPDPAKRDELLAQYKDVPECGYCGKNIATKEVPRDIVLFPNEPTIKAGVRLCISCYEGVKFQYEEEAYEQWKAEYDKLEQEYKDGKIPYSMLVEAKEKYEAEHPGIILEK